MKADYDLDYSYSSDDLCENTSREKQDSVKEEGASERKLLWDEENRLEAININGFISGYWYDAAGERVIKSSGDD